VLLAVTLLAPHRLAGQHPPAPKLLAQTFEVQLGAEERVAGPSGAIDSTYFSEKDATTGRLVGYMGNATTYRYETSGNTRLAQGKVALQKGAVGTFDGCGAWLSSVYQVTKTHWVGWYHAEAPGADDKGLCDYADASTVWRVAFAESFDAGKTWKKPSYPNNKVLTQDTALNGPITEDAGNPRVIRVGDYLYMFFQAATSNTGAGSIRQLNVARAPLSSLGKPGSWKKYYCTPQLFGDPKCDFTEPGIGGRSTAMSNISAPARFVSYNSYLGRYIAPLATGRWGFSLRIADNGPADDFRTWASAATIYPAVSTTTDTTVDQWGTRTASSRQLYAYGSVLGADGNSTTTGRVFYLYYVKVFPKAGFTQRNLFRRKVTLVRTDGIPSNRVQLTTYVDGKGHRRTTTELPQSTAYHVQSNAGSLLAVARDGWKDVYDCSATKGDAYLRTTACPAGTQAVRRIGYVSPTRTALATVAIYQCWDKRTARHFSSNSGKCSGARKIGVLGYGLPTLS
jgi:hypothetical protein